MLETKGDQLLGNLDTMYKEDLFAVCNKYAQEISADEFFGNMPAIHFEMVKQSTWKQQIESLFK